MDQIGACLKESLDIMSVCPSVFQYVCMSIVASVFIWFSSRHHCDFSCHSSEPPEEARKPQSWLAVLTFPIRGRGLLEQILFVQSWSTFPAVVASMKLLNGSISIQLVQ